MLETAEQDPREKEQNVEQPLVQRRPGAIARHRPDDAEPDPPDQREEERDRGRAGSVEARQPYGAQSGGEDAGPADDDGEQPELEDRPVAGGATEEDRGRDER